MTLTETITVNDFSLTLTNIIRAPAVAAPGTAGTSLPPLSIGAALRAAALVYLGNSGAFSDPAVRVFVVYPGDIEVDTLGDEMPMPLLGSEFQPFMLQPVKSFRVRVLPKTVSPP